MDGITVKPQKLEHGNLRTLPKIRTRISVPTKNVLNSTSSSSEKSHTVKLELSITFHGPKRKIGVRTIAPADNCLWDNCPCGQLPLQTFPPAKFGHNTVKRPSTIQPYA